MILAIAQCADHESDDKRRPDGGGALDPEAGDEQGEGGQNPACISQYEEGDSFGLGVPAPGGQPQQDGIDGQKRAEAGDDEGRDGADEGGATHRIGEKQAAKDRTGGGIDKQQRSQHGLLLHYVLDSCQLGLQY